MPKSLRQASETEASTETLTPKADKTSARRRRLLGARLPVLATGKPAPAITNAAAVDMLKVFAELEPVPAVSIKQRWSELILTARARIPSASAASSSIVSPLRFNAI